MDDVCLLMKCDLIFGTLLLTGNLKTRNVGSSAKARPVTKPMLVTTCLLMKCDLIFGTLLLTGNLKTRNVGSSAKATFEPPAC